MSEPAAIVVPPPTSAEPLEPMRPAGPITTMPPGGA
jgi:hypothetical protein